MKDFQSKHRNNHLNDHENDPPSNKKNATHHFTNSTNHNDSLSFKYQNNCDPATESSSKHKKFFDWHYTSFSRRHVNFELDFTYSFHQQLIYNKYPIESFVVHWPEVAYGLTFDDKDTESKSYLVFKSNTAMFDLANKSTYDGRFSGSLSLNISCSASSTGVHQAMQFLEEDCTLLTSLNLVEFKNELTHNKFINTSGPSTPLSLKRPLLAEHVCLSGCGKTATGRSTEGT